MGVKNVVISDLTHEDLSDFFSTATYGSQIFHIAATCEPLPNECREDTWARALLEGGVLCVYDRFAEGEDDAYGKLPYEWDEERGAMAYWVTLRDIEKGIAKAYSTPGFLSRCALHLINPDFCCLDLEEAEAILQIIVFGELIYG